MSADEKIYNELTIHHAHCIYEVCALYFCKTRCRRLREYLHEREEVKAQKLMHLLGLQPAAKAKIKQHKYLHLIFYHLNALHRNCISVRLKHTPAIQMQIS